MKNSLILAAMLLLSAGFYDQSHFYRVIKHFTGLTPTEYRKDFRG